MKYFIFLSLFISLSTHASLKDDLITFLKKHRNHIEKFIGQDKTDQLLGKRKKIYNLPSIPNIDSKENPEKFFDKKIDNGIQLSIDVERKYFYPYVKEIFEVTRKTNNIGGEPLNRWVNALMQGASREGIYRAMVLDNDYAGLENYPRRINQEVANFAYDFFKTYINKERELSRIRKYNFFSLKRIAVEKSLEVIDAFGNSRLQLLTWYGIYSSDIAKKYAGAWTVPMRKETSVEKHIQWGKSVPLEHLKSEIIIKTHKVFNFLENN